MEYIKIIYDNFYDFFCFAYYNKRITYFGDLFIFNKMNSEIYMIFEILIVIYLFKKNIRYKSNRI